MCGQGFMPGPGLGEEIAWLITKETCKQDNVVLSGFSLYRNLSAQGKPKDAV
jgi:sarcosine oxidase subunit beta